MYVFKGTFGTYFYDINNFMADYNHNWFQTIKHPSNKSEVSNP